MRALCVIPARIGSTRLPQKPLQRIGGEPLVSSITQRILAFGVFGEVVLGTDSVRVAHAVQHLPVEVVLTSSMHRCGTERVAEVVGQRPHELVVNVQCDEVFIPREAVTGVLGLLQAGATLATAAMDLTPEQEADSHTTKVAVARDGGATGFHRTREGLGDINGWVGRHVGIYGYRREALFRWVSREPTVDERTLGLEQLRPMSYGERFAVARLEGAGCTGIDTPSDLEAAESYMTASTERVLV